VLRPQGPGPGALPLPASPKQVRPLLGQLDTHPEAAIEMWKAAVADAKGKVPTFDQVNRPALAYKANEARRLSATSHMTSRPLQRTHHTSLATSPDGRLHRSNDSHGRPSRSVGGECQHRQ
jgi:hypothetical protein